MFEEFEDLEQMMDYISGLFLFIFLLLTIPIWIFPYLIYKYLIK